MRAFQFGPTIGLIPSIEQLVLFNYSIPIDILRCTECEHKHSVYFLPDWIHVLLLGRESYTFTNKLCSIAKKVFPCLQFWLSFGQLQHWTKFNLQVDTAPFQPSGAPWDASSSPSILQGSPGRVNGSLLCGPQCFALRGLTGLYQARLSYVSVLSI